MKISLSAISICVAMLVAPLMSQAMEIRTGQQVSTQSSEIITGDMYMTGGSVVSAGEITGDLIAGGGTVLVTGVVGADALIGGGTITIISEVRDDLRIGGGNILVQGRVGGDIVVGGGQVTIGGLGIGGDVLMAGGSIRIDAPVAGAIRIAGGDVYINAPVGGDVVVEAGTLTLGSGAVIHGNVTYHSEKEMTKESGASVIGSVEWTPRVRTEMPDRTTKGGILALLGVGKFLMLFLSALVLGLGFKRYSVDVLRRVTERPFFEMGRGFIVLVVMPVLSVLLMMTLLGIPFGFILALGYIVLLLVAWIVSPIVVGSLAFKYLAKRELEVNWKTILVGTIVYSLISIVPILGGIFCFILMLTTLGAMVALKQKIASEWR